MKQVQAMQAAAPSGREILWQEPEYDIEDAVRRAREDRGVCRAFALGVALMPAVIALAPSRRSRWPRSARRGRCARPAGWQADGDPSRTPWRRGSDMPGTVEVLGILAAGVAVGAAVAYIVCAAWAAQALARAEERAARLALATAVMQGRIVCSAADGRHVFLVTELRRD